MSKYCTLPGQEPVRLTSLDGTVIIIGDTLRDIPEQFVLKAKAAGCLTEEELEGLKRRLLGDAAGDDSKTSAGDDSKTDDGEAGTEGAAGAGQESEAGQQSTLGLDSDNDGFAAEAPTPAAAPAAATSEKTEQGKAKSSR